MDGQKTERTRERGGEDERERERGEDEREGGGEERDL